MPNTNVTHRKVYADRVNQDPCSSETSLLNWSCKTNTKC